MATVKWYTFSKASHRGENVVKDILPYLYLPLISLGGMGLAFGAVLAYNMRKLKSKEKVKRSEVEDLHGKE